VKFINNSTISEELLQSDGLKYDLKLEHMTLGSSELDHLEFQTRRYPAAPLKLPKITKVGVLTFDIPPLKRFSCATSATFETVRRQQLQKSGTSPHPEGPKHHTYTLIMNSNKAEKNLEAPASSKVSPSSNEGGFVEYDGPNDHENPKNWSTAYKWSIVALISFLALT